jgi:hypothetical protein
MRQSVYLQENDLFKNIIIESSFRIQSSETVDSVMLMKYGKVVVTDGFFGATDLSFLKINTFKRLHFRNHDRSTIVSSSKSAGEDKYSSRMMS